MSFAELYSVKSIHFTKSSDYCLNRVPTYCFKLQDWIPFADPANAAASQANKEEADSRSVFVGNVW